MYTVKALELGRTLSLKVTTDHLQNKQTNFLELKITTLKLHKLGPLLQTAGHPFPLLLGQPSSALLSTAQAGGPPSVEIGWATKTIIFEDVRGHKMTSFFTCKFFGQFAVQGIFSPHLYY